MEYITAALSADMFLWPIVYTMELKLKPMKLTKDKSENRYGININNVSHRSSEKMELPVSNYKVP